MPANAFKYYSYVLALVPVLALLVIALLNFVVDPYRLYSSNASALYEKYPALHANLRMHKAHQVNLQKPDTIILGTSKAIQGIPLDHTYFEGKAVYNLAAPLASMREIYHLAEHAQANRALDEILFVADFLSFNVLARVDGPAAGYVEGRLKTADVQNRYWPDYLASMVSADALKASVNVVRAKENSSHRVLNGLGGRENGEIASRLTDGGHRSNSQMIESFFVDSVLLAAPYRQFATSSSNDNSFVWFEEFLSLVHKQGIQTTVAIGPSHMRYWELLNQGGLWQDFENWKAQMVETNQRVALEQGKQPITLLDFSLPNEITSETFPIAGDSDTAMRYYYESIHFNQHTGGLMLDRINGQNADALPSNFGVQLSPENITQINTELRVGLDGLREQSPTLIEELQLALPHELQKKAAADSALTSLDDEHD